jgi:hypothetical protein
MSEAVAWLSGQIAQAPPQLRERMIDQLPDADSVARSLAEGARACLQRMLRDPAGTEAALELLAADGLLTHAAAAAAEQGAAALAEFCAALDASYFQRLLDQTA